MRRTLRVVCLLCALQLGCGSSTWITEVPPAEGFPDGCFVPGGTSAAVLTSPPPLHGSGNASFSRRQSCSDLSVFRFYFTIRLSAVSDVTHVTLNSGGVGDEGPARVLLFAGPATGEVEGTLVSSFFDPDVVSGIAPADLWRQMCTGGAYVSVQTAPHPEGELRGQLNREGFRC